MNGMFVWTGFLPTRIVKGMATLGPLGYMGKAPGTNGSLAGLFWYSAFLFPIGLFPRLLIIALFIYLAVAFCGEAENRMFKNDPKEIVLDEFVAMPVCFLGLPPYMGPQNMWLFMIVGFLLFRFFDILKPIVLKKMQGLPGGLGIVADDLGAAVCTCLILHLANLAFSV